MIKVEGEQAAGNRHWVALAVILGVILFDQIFKIWIKTNMYLGQEFSVFGNWFIIHFVENNGIEQRLSLKRKKGSLWQHHENFKFQ